MSAASDAATSPPASAHSEPNPFADFIAADSARAATATSEAAAVRRAATARRPSVFDEESYARVSADSRVSNGSRLDSDILLALGGGLQGQSSNPGGGGNLYSVWQDGSGGGGDSGVPLDGRTPAGTSGKLRRLPLPSTPLTQLSAGEVQGNPPPKVSRS